MKEDVQLGLNRIQGKVLTELGGVGVPNLVVAAFDFDPQRWAQFIKLQSGTQLEGDVPVGDILSAMNDMGEGVQLQRLGSVITSDTGEFELTYADAMFSDTVEVGGETIDRDRRPDIILLVLMPDRADQYGEGLQLKDRLLHYTRHVQYESGRTESFVIRISEDRLREAGVPFPSAATSDERELVVSVSHYESTRNQEHQAEVQLRSTKQALHASLDVPQLVIEKQLVDRVLPTLLPRRLGRRAPDACTCRRRICCGSASFTTARSTEKARRSPSAHCSIASAMRAGRTVTVHFSIKSWCVAR
jgi:hypothetical protein